MSDAPPGPDVSPEALHASRLSLGPLGLGLASLREVEEAEAEALIETAWRLGIRHFDTAPHYGAGLSERRAGAALRAFPREQLVLSTKVGRTIGAEPGFDFSRDGVEASLYASLERLGVDRVDVAYLHDPEEHYDAVRDSGFPALAALRDEGLVRAIGIGTTALDGLAETIRELQLDVLLLAGRYTLLDQSAAADVLPACAERGVRVVAGMVFHSGLLVAPSPQARFDYGPVPPQQLQTALALERACAARGVPLGAAAIQFPRGHPAVETVLFGADSAAQVERNVAAMRTAIPAALWSDLKAASLLPPGAACPFATEGAVNL